MKEEAETAARLRCLTEMVDLITRFLESSGKQANITRKFYFRLFFTEFVTRTTKTRSEYDLDDLLAEENRVFKTVDLPFQDTYTKNICRTIQELWDTDFVEGVPPIPRAIGCDDSESSKYFDWRVPTPFYLRYIKDNDYPASGALLSQQRGHYRKLIQELRLN